MKDVSIEYAHIYTGGSIDTEYVLSLDVLSKAREEYAALGKTASLVVLVDDYSFPDPTFSYNIFLKELAHKGFAPDIVLRESQLIPLCDEVLGLVTDSKLKDSITEYVQTRKKYPCSLFIAAWYLLRLGCISSPLFNAKHAAPELLNILPESFRSFEEKASAIISETRYANTVAHIHRHYFEGRLIA